MRRAGCVVLAAVACAWLTAAPASARTQDPLRLPLEKVVSQRYPAFPVADPATGAGAYRPHPAQCDDPALSCDRVPVEVERSPAGRSDVTIDLHVLQPANRMELLVYETVDGSAALVIAGRPAESGITASFTATGPRYDVVVVHTAGDSAGYGLRLASRLVSRNAGAGAFARTGTTVDAQPPGRSTAPLLPSKRAASDPVTGPEEPARAPDRAPAVSFPSGERPVELDRALPSAAVPEEPSRRDGLWLLLTLLPGAVLALVVAVRRSAVTRR